MTLLFPVFFMIILFLLGECLIIYRDILREIPELKG